MSTPWWDQSGAFVLYGAAVSGGLGLTGVWKVQRGATALQLIQLTRADRVRAYEELVEAIERIHIAIQRVEQDESAPLPEPLTDEQEVRVAMLRDAHASKRVSTLTDQWTAAVREYYRKRTTLQSLQHAIEGSSEG